MQFYSLPWVFTLEHFVLYFMVGEPWIGSKYNVMTHTAASSKAFVLFSDSTHLHFYSTEQGMFKNSLYHCNLYVVSVEMYHCFESQKSDFIWVNCLHPYHCGLKRSLNGERLSGFESVRELWLIVLTCP